MRLRNHCFYRLPLKALAIGHPDVRKARAGLVIALAQFRMEVSGASHEWIQAMFVEHPDSLLPSVLAVIHGDRFDAHPQLQQQRRKAMFVSNSEIGVERDHAQLHQNILAAHNHSEAYASIHMRKYELVEALENDKEVLESYNRQLMHASSADKILLSLDLMQHPSLPAQPGLDGRYDIKTVREIVYRSDLLTQYSEFPEDVLAAGPGDDGPGSGGGGGPGDDGPGSGAGGGIGPGSSSGAGGSGGSGPGSSSGAGGSGGTGGSGPGRSGDSGLRLNMDSMQDAHEDILQQLKARISVDHFLTFADPATVYYLPRVSSLRSLESMLMKKIPMPDWLDVSLLSDSIIDFELLSSELDFGDMSLLQHGDEMEVQPQASNPSPGDQGRNVFFQIVSKNPDKLLGKYHDSELTSSDKIIAVLPTRVLDPENQTVIVDYDSAHGDATGHVVQRRELEVGIASLRECVPTGEPIYSTKAPVEGCDSSAASDALRALMQTGAVESLDSLRALGVDCQEEERMNALKALQKEGYVEQVSDTGEISRWRMTVEGMSLISRSTALMPGPLVSKPRADIELKNMTVLELWHHLSSKMWKPEVWWKKKELRSSTESKPPPFIVKKNAPKIWWVHENQLGIDKQYLLAFSQLDLVRHEEIHHFRQAKYYKNLYSKPEDSKLQITSGGVLDLDAQPPAKKKARKHEDSKSVQKEKKDDHRSVHPRSYKYGAGLMTFLPPKTWRARCPRYCGAHQPITGKAFCTWKKTFNSEEKDKEVQLLLRHWMNSCVHFRNRKAHMDYRPTLKQLPPASIVEAEKLEEDWDSEHDERAVKGTVTKTTKTKKKSQQHPEQLEVHTCSKDDAAESSDAASSDTSSSSSDSSNSDESSGSN